MLVMACCVQARSLVFAAFLRNLDDVGLSDDERMVQQCCLDVFMVFWESQL